MKAWKYSGYYLIATGAIHNVVGVQMGWETLKEIAADGFINTINAQMDRQAIFWFILAGFLLMMIGGLYQDQIQKSNQPLPKRQGYYLLVLSLIGCAMMPNAGFWIVIPQAILIILPKYKEVPSKQSD